LTATLPGAESCTLTYHWTNTATVGHLTDGVAGHADDFDSTSATATYTADCTGTGSDTIGVAISATGPNASQQSLGNAAATVDVQAPPQMSGRLGRNTVIGVCTSTTTTTTPTTSTTLPRGGREFFLGPAPDACCTNVDRNACSMDLSVAGQPCTIPYLLCICSVAGVIPNNVFYAYPGDSVSIRCFTCNEQCFDYGTVLYNGPAVLFPNQQVCLPSPPPANTWTEVVDASAPIPFPQNAPTQYCCDLGPAHCTDGTPCVQPSDCPDYGCIGGTASCFEYVVGSPEELNCVQMGGNPTATYCGQFGCGVD
jgi:hypothetical protein